MREIFTRIFRFCLYMAIFIGFLAYGIYVYGKVSQSGIEEVFGYDYETYMSQFRSLSWISYTGFRHPGLGLLLSPIVSIAAGINVISAKWCDYFLICLIAFVGTLNVLLVKSIGGWVSAGVFMSFGFAWVLAAVPESFPFAMLSLLLTVLLAKRRESISEKSLGKADCLWGVLAITAAAITITNGVKVLLAYYICNWKRLNAITVDFMGRRVRLLAVLICTMVLAVLAGFLFFYCRLYSWNLLHPDAPKSLLGSLAKTISWIPPELGLWGRIKGIAINMIAVPIVPDMHMSSCWDVPTTPTIPMLIWVFGLCSLAVIGGWVHRNEHLVKTMVAMFAVDFTIHGVIGWGLDESWIFCAHWFWMVPILVGLLFRRPKVVRQEAD